MSIATLGLPQPPRTSPGDRDQRHRAAGSKTEFGQDGLDPPLRRGIRIQARERADVRRRMTANWTLRSAATGPRMGSPLNPSATDQAARHTQTAGMRSRVAREGARLLKRQGGGGGG
jgi:hypothetical protein